jgi:hypothetical protein
MFTQLITVVGKGEVEIVTCSELAARHYSMKITDFFTKAWITPRLSLINSWFGTNSPIVYSVRHPIQPLLYIKFADQTNAIYSLKEDLSQVLTGLFKEYYGDLIALPSFPSMSIFSWFPCGF